MSYGGQFNYGGASATYNYFGSGYSYGNTTYSPESITTNYGYGNSYGYQLSSGNQSMNYFGGYSINGSYSIPNYDYQTKSLIGSLKGDGLVTSPDFISTPITAATGAAGSSGISKSGWGISLYDGVPIISSPWVEPGGAFTPGPFIIAAPDVNPRANLEDQDLIRHEIGHVLTYASMGLNLPVYLGTIGLPSAINHQTGLGGPHSSFYTEKVANTFSTWVYGPFLGRHKALYPTY